MKNTQIRSLDIPGLLDQNHIHPEKGLGQNFLQDEDALREITTAAQISAEDNILEIGPGIGSLTRHLAQCSCAVIAVELDSRLLPVLTSVLSSYSNVRVIQGDILKINTSTLMDKPDYLVVANIPYNITSILIRQLLETEIKPKRIVLTIQEEVADRICASPGNMSLLALSVQLYGRPEVKFRIPAQAFYPVPKVDSAVVRIDLHAHPVIPSTHINLFFRLAKAGFAQKRKTLRNSLAPLLGRERTAPLLEMAGINPSRRAETLSLEEWKNLCELV